MAAGLLAVTLLAAVDRQAIDIEGHSVDAVRPQVVEGLDEDFHILAVDHHAVVVVRLDDARLRRLVGLDGQAARQIDHDRVVAIQVPGLRTEAQHLADALVGHLEVELEGSR